MDGYQIYSRMYPMGINIYKLLNLRQTVMIWWQELSEKKL